MNQDVYMICSIDIIYIIKITTDQILIYIDYIYRFYIDHIYFIIIINNKGNK